MPLAGFNSGAAAVACSWVAVAHRSVAWVFRFFSSGSDKATTRASSLYRTALLRPRVRLPARTYRLSGFVQVGSVTPAHAVLDAVTVAFGDAMRPRIKREAVAPLVQCFQMVLWPAFALVNCCFVFSIWAGVADSNDDHLLSPFGAYSRTSLCRFPTNQADGGISPSAVAVSSRCVSPFSNRQFASA